MDADKTLNVLFVCSMNQWRSPTGEKVFSNRNSLRVRSAGTSSKAKRTVSAADLKWANIVFAMEPKHRQRLRADFPGQTKYLELRVLHIPDDYQFMDEELVEEIVAAVEPILASKGI